MARSSMVEGLFYQNNQRVSLLRQTISFQVASCFKASEVSNYCIQFKIFISLLYFQPILVFKSSTATPWSDAADATSQSEPLTPTIATPRTATSDAGGFFSTLCSRDAALSDELSLETFRKEIDDEITKFKQIISNDNFAFILKVKSTSSFWANQCETLPKLKNLAAILMNVPSTSASLERFFSICGFISNKRSRSIDPDNFIKKCMLRANFEIVKNLNSFA